MLKNLYASETIYNTIRPYYCILKGYGFIPFTIADSARNQNEITVHIKCLDVFNFLKSLLFCLGYVTLMDPFLSVYHQDHETTIQNIGGFIMYVSEIVIVNGFLFNNLVSRHRILNFIKTLHEFDENIKCLGFTVNHNRQKWCIIGHLSTTFVIYMLVLTMFYYYNHMYGYYNMEYLNLLPMIFLIFVNEGYILILSQLTFALMAVQSRFKLLNKCFRHFFKIAEGSETLYDPKYFHMRPESIINSLAIQHDLLNDALDEMNISFSVPTAGAFASCFIFQVFIMHDIMLTAAKVSERIISMTVVDFMWTVFTLLLIVNIIALANSLTKEGNLTKRLIIKATPFVQDQDVIQRLSILGQQIQHRSPIVTSGLFSYDWKLFFTMIGATATYLIILLQFEITIHKIENHNDTVLLTLN